MSAAYRNIGSVPKAIADAQRDADLVETLQVAAQPHRRGDSSILAGSETGRFIKSQMTSDLCLEATTTITIAEYRREVFDACETYARVCYRLNLIKGVPMPSNMAWDFANREDVAECSHAKILQLGLKRDICERALKSAGIVGFRAARDLILFEIPVPEIAGSAVRRALQGLQAVHGGGYQLA